MTWGGGWKTTGLFILPFVILFAVAYARAAW